MRKVPIIGLFTAMLAIGMILAGSSSAKAFV